MYNYREAHGRFPAAAIQGPDGKPLLSWRVAVLPYLAENDLYQSFKLDEPWDSPHNKPLLERMPRLFAPPQPAGRRRRGASRTSGSSSARGRRSKAVAGLAGRTSPTAWIGRS